MRRWLAVGLIVGWAGATGLGAEVPAEEVARLSGYGWKLPSQLGERRLEKLLQIFVKRTEGKAFRYLGVSEDFFHGHVLFEARGEGGSRRLYPRAILYHTQEEAYSAHWRDLDKKYDYVDVAARNWIQWLSDDPTDDGEPVENARRYLDTRRKDPRQFETDLAAPQEGLHYTIHSYEVDGRKLGFEVFGELQYEFYEDDCAEPRGDVYRLRRGPVRIHLFGGKEACLSFATHVPFLEQASRLKR